MADFATFGNLLGHLAFAVLALSFLLTNIYWLRVVAAAGLVVGIVCLTYAAGDPRMAIVWAAILILINLYHLVLLTRERMSLRLPESEAPFLRASLAGLSDEQIAKLLKAADWKDCVAGDVLTRQDAPVDALYFLCSGRASVAVNGSLVTNLEKGSFIGEIAYLTGNPATATVTIEETSRLLAFSKMRIAKVVSADEQISGIVYQLLGRDLANKMRRTNTRRVLLADDEGIRV